MREICYVSGTRADFGLMRRTLLRAAAIPGVHVTLCVTGMHLSPLYGYTVAEVERSGLDISARISVDVETTTGASMAAAISVQIAGMTAAWQQKRPSVVLLLGDRGEMLAAAIAAIHLNVPIVHVHGGELSGTIDEPVRHAISKLSHYHFTATEAARQRLIRMGEHPENVFVTGAPGLDGILDFSRESRQALCASAGLDPQVPVAIVIYHPVVQAAQQAGEEMREVLGGVASTGVQMLCLMPNADAGSSQIRAALSDFARGHPMKVFTHLERDVYLSWLAAAEVLVGNSSSGIIEAASFGLPVVNVGDRQVGRERNANTADVAAHSGLIAKAVEQALGRGRYAATNVYGDGAAGERISRLLSILPFSPEVLNKRNAY